jgi:hypothetical protein
MNSRIFFALTLVCVLLGRTAAAAGVTPEGARLAHLLDQTHVEALWPAGVHVSWQTGEPDGRPETTEGKHTHCSAFVASTAKKLGVYILRPPEHGQTLLANAQYDWLADEGQKHGWHEIHGGLHAQQSANGGDLVVATYHNHHDDKPGHIAIIRPSEKSRREIEQEGPQIIQAGGTNYTSTTLKRGFAGHPAAFTRDEVRYYAHSIDWQKVH